MEVLGYVVAGMLAICMVIGATLAVKAMRKNQKIKSVSLKPWTVDIQFYDNEY